MDSLYKWMSVYILVFFDPTARIRLDTVGSSNGLLSLCLAFTYQLLVPPKFIPRFGHCLFSGSNVAPIRWNPLTI